MLPQKAQVVSIGYGAPKLLRLGDGEVLKDVVVQVNLAAIDRDIDSFLALIAAHQAGTLLRHCPWRRDICLVFDYLLGAVALMQLISTFLHACPLLCTRCS